MDIEDIINLKLLSHPANWLIVWVVLLFGGVAMSILHKTVSAPALPQNDVTA